VTGTTNLPDGTEVDVYASRAFRAVGEQAVRAGNVGVSRQSVMSGAFAANIAFDYANLLVGVGPRETHAAVSSMVDVCADVRTGLDHDGSPRQSVAGVRRLLGDSGEAFEGAKSVEEFGSATPTPSNSLHVEAEVDSPPPLERYASKQNPAPKPAPLDGHCVGG